MEYVEYMNNLRYALKMVSDKVPDVIEVIEAISQREKDQDLEIALLPDEMWYHLQRKYDEVEHTIHRFNAEEEYGVIHTMWPEDMRGE